MLEKRTQPGENEIVHKPWGYELIWAHTRDYTGKLLVIRAGHSLSLQYHQVKEETIFVEAGLLILETGDSEGALQRLELRAGDSYHIPPRLIHRFTAETECRVFEVSTPHLSDVVRLKDNYGRA